MSVVGRSWLRRVGGMRLSLPVMRRVGLAGPTPMCTPTHAPRHHVRCVGVLNPPRPGHGL